MNPITDDQDKALLLGFLAAILRAHPNLADGTTVHPDQIDVRSPWTGNLFAVKLERRAEPKFPFLDEE